MEADAAARLIELHRATHFDDVLYSKATHPHWFDLWKGDIPDDYWPSNLLRNLRGTFQAGLHPPACPVLTGGECRLVMCPDYGGDLSKAERHAIVVCVHQ